jgi:ADP-dependent NAD(P)H-hydrate dehydratase
VLRRWPLPQPAGSGDKRDRGVALIVGGAAQVPGALLLAGIAALRVGAGKLQLAAPQSAATQLAVALPEARVFGLRESRDGFLDRRSAARVGDCAPNADAILVGPGMLDEDAAIAFVDQALPKLDAKRLVIDAVALTALKDGRHRFAEETRVVLTPNQSEMARITGDKPATIEADPLGVATRVAKDLNVVVALKGPQTLIATPDGEIFRYAEGDVGLATSGSGDVLAGALVGLLARGATPDQAAVWATYLHGAAGNRLARKIGPVGFLARELSSELPGLMNGLAGKRGR